VYSYYELASPPMQRVIRLIALCPACHAVKHLYRTHAVSIERGDPGIYRDALAHLARINEWDDAQVQAHLEETGAAYERRQALGPWRQDFSALGVQAPATEAEIRAWARRNGHIVPDRGPVRAEIREAFRQAVR
jgi:Lsr2